MTEDGSALKRNMQHWITGISEIILIQMSKLQDKVNALHFPAFNH
jgi:hypothetical protein